MEEFSYFLYYLTLTEQYQNQESWDDKTLSILNLHGDFLEDLRNKGKLILAGRTDYEIQSADLFGIAIIKARSISEAGDIMKGDPAVVNGIQESQIHPFRLAIKD